MFIITKIECADGTFVGVEGEHDFPYLVEYGPTPQPGLDEETLAQLAAEAEEDAAQEQGETS
jgi:hypothetical protein